MNGEIADEVLWSWIDRDAVELEAHLARHPQDRPRVEALRAAIAQAGLAALGPPGPPPIPGFRILRRIGEGGMGIVYEAQQEHPRRRVALKVVRGGASAAPERLALFRREVDALARLDHPGIAAVYAAGTTEGGDPWFAMEHALGPSLAAWVRERAPSRRQRVELVRRMAIALAHAHARGVVHCDLKPSNVVVGAEDEPKVLDFGLARISSTGPANARTTLAPGLAGTLAYASPEQARGERTGLGPTSDVWSLGVILYELLTGHLPHEHADANLVESARRIAECEPRPPSVHDRTLRGDLEAIVLRALERDPLRRYPDAGALGEDLGRWLGGLPVAARRRTAAQRLWRRVRRHKLASAAVLGLGAFAGVAAFALVFPTHIPWPLVGDWWREGAPWDELRWRGDSPQVRLGERWYELEAIDGLRTPFVVGFAVQHSGSAWRKRFSEDLVQVLNRMGNFCMLDVDLTLRDLESGERVVMRDVALDGARRRSTLEDRLAWPFELLTSEPSVTCRFEGRSWELLELEGVAAERLQEHARTRGRLILQPSASSSIRVLRTSELYDMLCELTGRSPGPTVALVLHDPATGERLALDALERRRPPAGRESAR